MRNFFCCRFRPVLQIPVLSIGMPWRYCSKFAEEFTGKFHESYDRINTGKSEYRKENILPALVTVATQDLVK